MPRGDGRGPNGMGPMTGRGLGYCAGYEREFGFGRRGGMGFGPGFGHGRGRGFGRGWGYSQYPEPGFDVDPGGPRPDLAAELAALKEQIKVLEERIAGSSDQDQI